VSNVLGEAIPPEKVEEMRKWKLNMAATELQHEICNAMIDIHLHSKFNMKKPEDTFRIIEMLHKKYTFVTYTPGSNIQAKFDHLIGYETCYRLNPT
jgi:Zn-dependent oligopeptidase